jgi:hypothetical protein
MSIELNDKLLQNNAVICFVIVEYIKLLIKGAVLLVAVDNTTQQNQVAIFIHLQARVRTLCVYLKWNLFSIVYI